MTNKKIVSIILPTYNTLEYTKLCVKSILKYTDYPFQLIVVDEGSTDGTQGYLKTLKAKLILNQKNKGVIHALDQGYQAVKSNFFCTLNDDVIVSKNWLKKLIEIYEKYPQVKEIGPIRPSRFCRYPYSKEDSKTVLERIKEKSQKTLLKPEEQLNLFCKGYSYDKLVENFKRINSFGDIVVKCPPGILSTCCALMEKKFINRIGRIVDTRFKIYGGEDADLSWRIAKAGYQIMITSKVYIHHFEHVSADINKLNREELLKENGRKFFLKWRQIFWQYIKKRLTKGMTLKDVVNEYWFIKRIFQIIKPNEIPQDIKTLSAKNSKLKKYLTNLTIGSIYF